MEKLLALLAQFLGHSDIRKKGGGGYCQSGGKCSFRNGVEYGSSWFEPGTRLVCFPRGGFFRSGKIVYSLDLFEVFPMLAISAMFRDASKYNQTMYADVTVYS